MPSQTTSSILLVRPANFGYNQQTASTNTFQQSVSSVKSVAVLTEFDAFANQLQEAKINVIVIEDTLLPVKPDAIFPNNWISFHEHGKVVLYPMLAENRRLERRMDIVEELKNNFSISEIIDLSYFEKENLPDGQAGKFLEGTGSLVLDRANKIAYAAISPRTNEEVLEVFCKKMNYTSVVFHTKKINSIPVYHTNVMMNVGENFAVVCTEIICPSPTLPKGEGAKEKVLTSLKNSGKEIIEISIEQIKHFAGNMLQVKNSEGKLILVMSKQAHDSLSKKQLNKIKSLTEILVANIPIIEQIGGGSVRCMMTEIF